MARRTQAGAPVVHGLHAAAWALDLYCARYRLRSNALDLSVRFDRFIYLEQAVEARLLKQGADAFIIGLFVEGAKAAILQGEVRDERPGLPPESVPVATKRPLERPLDLDINDLISADGYVSIPATSDTLSTAFPSLTKAFGSGAVGSLLSLSTLVGMHAPGLHSIFSKFCVRLDYMSGVRPLQYHVVKVQSLLRALETKVSGAGLTGSVNSFVRRPPVLQPSSLSILEGQVPASSGDRVLIIGGSRGLGEIAAKLCAMGGQRSRSLMQWAPQTQNLFARISLRMAADARSAAWTSKNL